MMENSDSYDAPEFDWAAAQGDIERAKTTISKLLSPTPTPRDEIIRQSQYSWS